MNEASVCDLILDRLGKKLSLSAVAVVGIRTKATGGYVYEVEAVARTKSSFVERQGIALLALQHADFEIDIHIHTAAELRGTPAGSRLGMLFGEASASPPAGEGEPPAIGESTGDRYAVRFADSTEAVPFLSKRLAQVALAERGGRGVFIDLGSDQIRNNPRPPPPGSLQRRSPPEAGRSETMEASRGQGGNAPASSPAPTRIAPTESAAGAAENARTSPVRLPRALTAFGETKTISAWAQDRRCRVPYSTLSARLREGVALEEALTTEGA